MATLYFHCSSSQEVLLDRCGSEIDDLVDARAHALQIIQAVITSDGPQDWRGWWVQVSDDEGVEQLRVPFSSVLGKPH